MSKHLVIFSFAFLFLDLNTANSKISCGESEQIDIPAQTIEGKSKHTGQNCFWAEHVAHQKAVHVITNAYHYKALWSFSCDFLSCCTGTDEGHDAYNGCNKLPSNYPNTTGAEPYSISCEITNHDPDGIFGSNTCSAECQYSVAIQAFSFNAFCTACNEPIPGSHSSVSVRGHVEESPSCSMLETAFPEFTNI